MLASENQLNWKSIRNLFLGIILFIIVFPLILLLFYAAQYKNPIERKAASNKTIPTGAIPDTPVTETPNVAAKIVLINPTTNKATYTTKEDEESTFTPSVTTPTATNTTTPPTEFIGTVTAISDNVAIFSYGNGNSVAITLTKTSPASLSGGTKAHVHSLLSNGHYIEDEIEIL